MDRKTGQPLFQPRIGRGPAKQRNTASMPIGEYLYSHKQIRDENIERKAKEISNIDLEKLKPVQIKTASNKILQKKKNEIFQTIFIELDSDSDGIIAANRINISRTFVYI